LFAFPPSHPKFFHIIFIFQHLLIPLRKPPEESELWFSHLSHIISSIVLEKKLTWMEDGSSIGEGGGGISGSGKSSSLKVKRLENEIIELKERLERESSEEKKKRGILKKQKEKENNHNNTGVF